MTKFKVGDAVNINREKIDFMCGLSKGVIKKVHAGNLFSIEDPTDITSSGKPLEHDACGLFPGVALSLVGRTEEAKGNVTKQTVITVRDNELSVIHTTNAKVPRVTLLNTGSKSNGRIKLEDIDRVIALLTQLKEETK